MNTTTSRTSALTRRALLRMGGVGVIATPMIGCDLFGTDPAAEAPGGPSEGADGGEAPMLARRVESGDLPPVAERLPTEPAVVQPVDRPGVYGGTWHTALQGPEDVAWLGRTVGYDPPVRWSIDLSEVEPNVVERFEVSPDALRYTFHLRPGMKWSDGEPFTADDVVFAQNDVLSNETLYPVQTTPATATKLDDHTVEIVFEQPNGLFLKLQATDEALVQHPRHYLEQFHEEYNPDVAEVVEDEGVESWSELFLAKSDPWANSDLPRLHAWVPTTTLGEGSRMTFERNPYYWKVDPQGRQLPYIDTISYQMVADPEVMLLNATNGEFDMHVRHFTEAANKPILARSRDSGGYKFFEAVSSDMNQGLLIFNLTVKDSVKRQIFQNKDFRRGLSQAIDRTELINTVYQRQGEPWQAAPLRESELYDEEMATQYTEYDQDAANGLLDAAGYADRNEDGLRLGPSGEPISFIAEFPSDFLIQLSDVFELVQGYWREVGVDLQLRSESRELFAQRNQANDQDMLTWAGDSGLKPILKPDWYLPTSPVYLAFAPAWSAWYGSGGEQGEEPTEPAKQQMELSDQAKASADEQEQNDMMRQLMAIAKEEFWMIGTALPGVGYGIVKNTFHNAPTKMIHPSSGTPGQTHPEQYFIDETD